MQAAASACPAIRKARLVQGHTLNLRNAEVSDAAFVHALRTDPVRAQHLTAVPPQVQAQQQWLREYAGSRDQAYFIVTDKPGRPLGTVRLYGARGRAFGWGSWLLMAGLPARCGIESALMVYRYALLLGFDSAWFEVRQANVSVWRFHENFGAVRTGADLAHYHYELSPAALQAALQKYRRYLPDGVRVDF